MEQDKNWKGNGSRCESSGGLRRHQTLHPPSSFAPPSLSLICLLLPLPCSFSSSPFFLFNIPALVQLDIVLEQASKQEEEEWRFRGRRPSARRARRRCTWWTSSPPTTGSTTRPASGATIAREPSRCSEQLHTLSLLCSCKEILIKVSC